MISQISTQLRGETVREELSLLGRSQVELATFVDRTPNTIWNWLDGRTAPSLDDLARVAEFVQRGMLDIVRSPREGVDKHELVARLAEKFTESLKYALGTDHRRRVSLSMDDYEGRQLCALSTLVRFTMLTNRDHLICAPWILNGFGHSLDASVERSRGRNLVIRCSSATPTSIHLGFGLRESQQCECVRQGRNAHACHRRCMIVRFATVRRTHGESTLVHHFRGGCVAFERTSAGEIVVPISSLDDGVDLILWSESQRVSAHWASR